MYASVVPALRQFLGHGEGNINYMYLDSRPGDRKVTTGIGFLIDPLANCLERHRDNRLPWYRDARLATEQEVTQEWRQVKDMQDFARGQSGTAFAGRTALNLQLQQGAIEVYFKQLADDYRQHLIAGSPQRFGAFDTFPADAQMGILALAWAVGYGGILDQYDDFRIACFRRNWQAAANQSGWSTATAGRRSQVRQMFMNAHVVETQNERDRGGGARPTYDIARVYFPQHLVLAPPPPTLPGAPRTRPGR
jgi:hypothetical protein